MVCRLCAEGALGSGAVSTWGLNGPSMHSHRHVGRAHACKNQLVFMHTPCMQAGIGAALDAGQFWAGPSLPVQPCTPRRQSGLPADPASTPLSCSQVTVRCLTALCRPLHALLCTRTHLSALKSSCLHCCSSLTDWAWAEVKEHYGGGAQILQEGFCVDAILDTPHESACERQGLYSTLPSHAVASLGRPVLDWHL